MYIISRSKYITIISRDSVFSPLEILILQTVGVRESHPQFSLIFNIKMPRIDIPFTAIQSINQSLLHNIGLYSLVINTSVNRQLHFNLLHTAVY